MPTIKPLRWVASSKKDLLAFPEDVRQEIGYALYFAQTGDKHPAAKPLKGFHGAGVLEIVEDQKGARVMKLVTESSGNVFEDLGFANSKELLAKTELARQVYLIIKKRGLTQTAAGDLLGLKQPDVSLLMRGRLSRFSTDRLIQMLNVLDRDVEIVVKRKSSSKRKGSLRVIAA